MKRVVAALAALSWASLANGAPITGWAVHNGTSTVGGTPSAPTFTAADNITLMAPFADVELVDDGDSIEVSTTLTITGRTTTGVNSLNTQLRVGLFHFDGPDNSTVVANDVPNVGLITEYTNVAAGGLIREQASLAQTNPFNSPTDLGNGTVDVGGDSIRGANPGPVVFTLKLTRNGGELDLTGSITGTDSTTANPYAATYNLIGHSSATFPLDGTFTFNRIGLFLGDGVNGASASLADSTVTFVPEPASALMLAGIAGTALLARHRRGRRHVS